VPLEALVGVSNLWLTSRAFFSTQLAAVGVIVQYVLVGADFTTRGDLEAHRENVAAQGTDFVWEGNGLKPHLLRLRSIMRHNFLEDVCVHRR